MKWLGVFLGLLIVVPLVAQEEAILDWDISAIFYAPPPAVEEDSAVEEPSPLFMLMRPGFTLDGSFEFSAGLIPGWGIPPWFWNQYPEYERDFSWEAAGHMRIRFDLDTQLSEFLRVRSSLLITFPGSTIELVEFFFDYNLFHRFFFRGGRFDQIWGISPNFPFTNLIARVPHDDLTSDPFIMRVNIPVGIGGFQFLAITRENLLETDRFQHEDVGYGGKFNLALPHLDMDIGAFFQETMPLRSFLSVRTTIGQTEWYNEWLGVMDINNHNNLSWAANLGFFRDFFGNRVGINGEVFFNAERGSFWLRPETNIAEATTVPFNEGFNIALNLLYRFGGRGNPRFFIQALYAPEERSAQLIPGFRLSPWQHLELYLAVPMVLGDKDGHFFNYPPDPLHRDRTFTIVMLLTLSGSVRMGQN